MKKKRFFSNKNNTNTLSQQQGKIYRPLKSKILNKIWANF